MHPVHADQAKGILSSLGLCPTNTPNPVEEPSWHLSSVLPWIIAEAVPPLGVVIVVVREVDPLGGVGDCAVHEALQGPVSGRRLLGGPTRAFPLEDGDPQRGALVHVGAALELIEEAQHPLVHRIDLAEHTLPLPWEVEQPRDVMLAGNDQGVGLQRAAPAAEGGAAVGAVPQDPMVGLASLQGPVHEHAGHVGHGSCPLPRSPACGASGVLVFQGNCGRKGPAVGAAPGRPCRRAQSLGQDRDTLSTTGTWWELYFG